MKSTVAIQGIAGSFHSEAARLLLGESVTMLSCDNFAAVFKAVKSGVAQYGVVAVENSLQGSINAVYRLLAREQLWVSGEVFLKIEQYLIVASANLKLHHIERVISQPPALAQCELWLDAHVPAAVLEESNDTATSVRTIVAQADQPLAAIASKHAAELYHGHVLAGPINDDKHNYTRFFLLTGHEQPQPHANKTSIILETAHAPGSLQRALQLFADASINLSKLDSHPIPGDEWHYAFYIDFEAAADTPAVKTILKELEHQGCTSTILGSYKAAGISNG